MSADAFGPVIDVRLVRTRTGRWRVSVEGERMPGDVATPAAAFASLLLAFGRKEAPEEPDPAPDTLPFELPESL